MEEPHSIFESPAHTFGAESNQSNNSTKNAEAQEALPQSVKEGSPELATAEIPITGHENDDVEPTEEFGVHPDPQPKASETIPQDNFFHFYKDEKSPAPQHPEEEKHSIPQSINISRTRTQDQSVNQILDEQSIEDRSSDLFDNPDLDSSELEPKGDDCSVVIVCLCCLLLVLCLGLYWVFNGAMQPEVDGFRNNKDYPECTIDMFYAKIEKIINTKTSPRMQQQREESVLTYDAYEMIVDPWVVNDVIDHLYHQSFEITLIYGAINPHQGPLLLFDAVERKLKSEKEKASRDVVVWIYDHADLTKHNGTIHQRLMCLYQRANEWSVEHPKDLLLVVLDHISEHNRQESLTPVYNDWFAVKQWKGDHKWMLFVVESNPKKLIIDTENYGTRVFREASYSSTVAIPFIGGPIFQNVIQSLTANNPDLVTMDSVDEAQWAVLRDKMHGFTLIDTFNLYHDSILTKARSLEAESGNPVELKFEDILLLTEYTVGREELQFAEPMVQRMEKFAKLVHQTVYVDADGRAVPGIALKGNETKKSLDQTVR